MPAAPRDVLSRPYPPPDAVLRYGAHPDHVADLRRPAAGYDGSPRPLVIVIHGGFWRAEWDRSHTGPLAADLAAQGYPVVQLEYRRTGQAGGGWPGTFDDISAALGALPALVAEALGEPDHAGQPPILLGHSAGGQLALWYATQPGTRLRGVVALAPVADLGEAYRLDLDGGAVAALLGGGPEALPERYAAVDPIRRGPLSAPAVIVHGTLDQQVPLELSRRYAAMAHAAAGAPVNLVELPDVEHFALIDPRSPAWVNVSGALHSLSDDRRGLTEPPDSR